MQRSIPHMARLIAVSAGAVALGAAAVAVASPGSSVSRAARLHETHLRGTSSGGVRFLEPGQTVRLGRVGHFKFSASCSTDNTGGAVVTFDVTADTTAALDGNAPVAAGTPVNIHTNSDALDKKNPGAYDQVASASSSTEIARDGQEVDVFYTDGVNWPAGNGSRAHTCFAGYTGLQG
ncbi:MAG TPA: hypothetical protein VIX82_13085 [Solirubrobacteraceae bacterium]